MILVDVNVLVYAHRERTDDHDRYAAWLDEQRRAPAAFGVSDLVLSGFVRAVTHPRIFDPPSPTSVALEFADALRSQPNAVSIAPGRRHWQIFSELCRESGAKGNLVPGAYLAALGDRVRQRMDHHRPRLHPLSRASLAPPAALTRATTRIEALLGGDAPGKLVPSPLHFLRSVAARPEVSRGRALSRPFPRRARILGASVRSPTGVGVDH